LGRNAKTRWGCPAGLIAIGHLAVAWVMEAAGIANPPYAIRHNAFICKAL
jgi:hypothetical protein